jgi:hypothetical protein
MISSCAGICASCPTLHEGTGSLVAQLVDKVMALVAVQNSILLWVGNAR